MCQTSSPSNFEETEGENGIGVEGRRGKEEVKGKRKKWKRGRKRKNKKRKEERKKSKIPAI